MEQDNSLFQLKFDVTSKAYMMETSKWARFLAIVGFISLGIILIAIIVTTISNPDGGINDPLMNEAETTGYIIGTIIGSLIFVVLYFFPCYFLLRFANKMKASLLTDDVVSMNEAFRNLKITFRYLGIMTIIFVTLFLIGVLAGITGS